MSAVMVCSACVIPSRSSLRNMGNAGTYTLSLTNPQRKKSHGVRSGERGGQGRHATPSLGWIWLPCGCVSCDPGCTHWRSVISAWETWTVDAADGVRCARVRWAINFLLTFETAPFFCVHPVYESQTPNTVPYQRRFLNNRAVTSAIDISQPLMSSEIWLSRWWQWTLRFSVMWRRVVW